ncbi:MAG: hypothetical protein C0167_02915 [Nitrososphaera sp.]|nr:MAG: hypothetical protein C0167_02915 [Nitrososphaera sp.]
MGWLLHWWRFWRWVGRSRGLIAIAGESIDSMTRAFYYAVDRCMEDRRGFAKCVEDNVEWLVGSVEYLAMLTLAHDGG